MQPDLQEQRRVESLDQAGQLRARFLDGHLDVMPDLIGRLEALTLEAPQGTDLRLDRGGLSVVEELRILRSSAEPEDARQTLLELFEETASLRERALSGDPEAIGSLRPDLLARGRMDVDGRSRSGDLLVFAYDSLAFIADDGGAASVKIVSEGSDLGGYRMRGWLNPVVTFEKAGGERMEFHVDGRETGAELMADLGDRLIALGALWLSPDSRQHRWGTARQLFERFSEHAFYILACAFWPFVLVPLVGWLSGWFGNAPLRSTGTWKFFLLWFALGLPTTARTLIRCSYYKKRLEPMDFGRMFVGAPLMTFGAFVLIGAPVVSLIDLFFGLGFFRD